jgi:hypothetical protein
MSEDPITTPFLATAALFAFLLRDKIFNGESARRWTFAVFLMVGALSAIISGFGFNLALVRYYPLLPYLAYLAIAAAFAFGYRNGRPRMAIIGALAVVVANVAAEDFSNYNEYEEARELARIAFTSEEPIYTDPLNASRARFQMRLMGAARGTASQRIRHETPLPPGSLLFKTYRIAMRGENWCVIERKNVRPMNWTHAGLRAMRADDLFGAKVRRIIAKPEPVELVRLLPQRAKVDPYSGRACIEIGADGEAK